SGAEPSGCRVCCLHDRRAPRLYIRGQEGNGLGTNVHSLVYGMAIAAKYGMNFGGVVAVSASPSSHGVDVHRAMADLFGFTSYGDIFLKVAPRMDAHFADIQFLQSSMFAFDPERARPGLRVMLEVSNLILGMDDESVRGWKQEDYLTPRFMQTLRSQATPQLGARLRRFYPDGLQAPLAVLHVRRGDVSETHEKSRMTPNAWYLRMIARIRRHWPEAEVHVFSSTEGRHSPSEFDEFRAANATVHLDGDTLDDWAHFALAQVFVMAASSFSYAPALLNTNCVVFQLFPPGRFGDWMYSPDESRRTYEQEFGECIQRARRSFRRGEVPNSAAEP
ncbi:unnamed protein product, partial [Prorocentrum cordatum]